MNLFFILLDSCYVWESIGSGLRAPDRQEMWDSIERRTKITTTTGDYTLEKY